MKNTTSLLLAVLASPSLACMHGGTAQQQATAASSGTARTSTGHMAGMPSKCPMDIPGTQLSASDTPTGESLTFTTGPGQVAALRERVRGMAEMHNQHHAAPGRMHDGHGRGMMDGHGTDGGMGGTMMPPPSRATVEDVENGARIVVTPNDSADLQKLQSTVRMHAEHMQQNGCGSMHRGPAPR